jgi:hypothetical protein
MAVDLNWYPQNATWITNLTDIINGTGTFGFSFSPDEAAAGKYGGYNWCDMPHVRTEEYVKPGKEFELIYVEVVCHFSYSIIFFSYSLCASQLSPPNSPVFLSQLTIFT